MIHTSVEIAAGKTVTIPRSTDLVNSVAINGGYLTKYGYSGSSNGLARWYNGDILLEITAISSTAFTILNNTNRSSSTTLYYSYAE